MRVDIACAASKVHLDGCLRLNIIILLACTFNFYFLHHDHIESSSTAVFLYFVDIHIIQSKMRHSRVAGRPKLAIVHPLNPKLHIIHSTMIKVSEIALEVLLELIA